MRSVVLALAVGAVLVFAGCATTGPGQTPTAGTPTPSPAPSPTLGDSNGSPTVTATATKTPGSVPATATPTDAPTPTEEPTTVEYRIRPGSTPDEFASVRVTFQVVFVDDERDLGSCYPDVFVGPYKPTITPLPTPAGECHTSEPLTLDLIELTGERSLGNYTAPGSTSGHALVVTDVEATYQNGTAVQTINGMGGAELIRSSTRPVGPYGVQVGIEPAPDGRSYDYWFVHERYDVSER